MADTPENELSGTDAADTAPNEETTPEPAPTRAADAAPGGGEPGPTTRDNRRKVREGIVVSNKMEKTAVVAVIDRVRHPRYAKTVQRTKRIYAHDELNDVNIGDRVRVQETRPLSKQKRWRVVEVLERAK
jgi:small subunit ribosomal protein S17